MISILKYKNELLKIKKCNNLGEFPIVIIIKISIKLVINMGAAITPKLPY